MQDKRKNNGGHPNSGRKSKNEAGRRITYTPSELALKKYDSWENKADRLDAAIITQGVLPTEEQLLDFFKSDIFQVDRMFEEDYELAIVEFYRRFNKQHE